MIIGRSVAKRTKGGYDMEKVTLQWVTVELQLHSNRTKVKQPPMWNPNPRTMAHPSPLLSL